MGHLNHRFYLAFLLTLGSVAQAHEYDPHHLFIKMKNGKRLENSPLILSGQELIPGLYLVKTDQLEKLEIAAKTWDVEYVERDQIHPPQTLPEIKFSSENDILKNTPTYRSSGASLNDEYWDRLWGFDSKWGMSVSEAYEQLPPWLPGEVIVAVIDTGVDYTHEDLKNVMWKNSKEIPGDGIDNDGNGYIDDVHGINTVVRSRLKRRASGDPMGSHWHGTHVAGTIAAEQNNGIGIAGVASNVKIMAIRSVPDNSNESDSDIIESLLYAARNGAKIINCSFGKTAQAYSVRDTINSIGRDYGALVVTASGNNSMGPFRWYNIDEKPFYPASFDSENILTITSTTKRGDLSTFSNIGKISVDVAAPGSDIFSTVKGNRYSTSDGTSMATPNATGVAAMVLGYFPELTPLELKNILMKSAKPNKNLQGMMRSAGVINLNSALKEAQEYREKRWR